MRRLLATTLLVTAGLACDVDGSVGRDEQRGGGTGSGDTGNATGEGDGGATDGPGEGTSAGEGDGSGGGDDQGTGTTTTDVPSDTMPSDRPPVCHPVPDDNTCSECRKVNCCEELAFCLAHDNCLCFWECVHSDQMVDVCTAMCDGGAAAFGELHDCETQSCDSCL